MTMEAHVSAAARALSAFDPLEALRHVALRDDAPALALRGIAMAQLGELPVARKLLRRAARKFGPTHKSARARCLAAEAEVALEARDLDAAGQGLDAAASELEACGDLENAGFVCLLQVRHRVLLGRLGEAARTLSSLDLGRAPPRMVAMARLLEVEIAVRSVEPQAARAALDRAREAAQGARIGALATEVERAAQSLALPVARLHVGGVERPIDLGEAAAIVRSRELVVDGCRREVRAGRVVVSLMARPVLFALAVTLAEAFPAGASRQALIRQAFGARGASDSLRARLRVEVGRLRRVVEGLAALRATSDGFALEPLRGTRVLLLRPPSPGEASALLAVLATGESWSSSALAAALGASQRTVQRALMALLADGRVRAIGRARSRRWAAPPSAGFATPLLLSRAMAPELGDLS
jgi:hypothetical protein